MKEFEQYKLKNNCNVVLVPQKDTASITALVVYPVGSRYEPESIAGVSHYIEHLMFKGTKKRPDTLTLTKEIDRLGAEYNAFTGKEMTGYYIKADKGYSNIVLDILSDMLFESTFDPEEMEREKGPIIEEIRMYNDNPVMNIDNIFEDVLFAGCSLGRDIAGTVEHAKSWQRPDVLEFRDTYYSASNMTVVLAGNITEETRQQVAHYFGNQDEKPIPANQFDGAKFGSEEKQNRIVVQHKKTDQAQLMLGFPGFAFANTKNPAVSVMNTIFGGSMSSRLFIQIRERRGLAYHVRSGAENFRDTGYVFVRAGLEAVNINKAIEVIKEEIEKIISEGVTDEELADAKTHIRGALTLSLEDSSEQASWYAKRALFYSAITTPEEKLLQIEAVTAQDIQDVAKEIFDIEKMRIAIIGDVQTSDIVF